ncbi:helix-turn-helix domain-containing protein [Paenibacillus cremeus]|uniref:Helix-turn-helix domain-containing protein n=1 Tax=Paenibacillus cremeus TaxID=2163881 RepID=A0A559KFU2_9BACL|nr:helix-turn-helix domain-containing protein [Paenibacillus cremeus]TVY10991.1 helix-turn-helix domain-containing protein [Paenibacillus cremeus]
MLSLFRGWSAKVSFIRKANIYNNGSRRFHEGECGIARAAIHRAGKPGIVIRFLLPYMLVMLIPLFIGFFAYYKTVSLLEAEVVNSNMSLLEQTKQALSRRLGEIDTIVQQVTTDPKVNLFMQLRDPFEGANTYRILDTQKNVINYSMSNSFIYRYYLLFKNSGIVMSSSSIYEMGEFYGKILSYNQLNYRQWANGIMNTYHHHDYWPAQAVTLEGKPYMMVTHVHSLGYPIAQKGAILVLIQNSEIQKLLSGFNMSEGGWAYIADETGAIISSISSDGSVPPAAPLDWDRNSGVVEKMMRGQRMMITYTTSEYNGWKYVAAQPTHVVLEKVNYIKRITWAVITLGLLAALLISSLLAYHNSRPVRKLVAIIGERLGADNGKPADVYDLIQDTLSTLMIHNEELKSNMQSQLPLLRSAVLGKLFKGDYASPREMFALFKHTGMDYQAHRYAVFVLQTLQTLQTLQPQSSKSISHISSSDVDTYSIMLMEAASEAIAGRAYLYEMSKGKIAFLTSLNLSESATDELQQLLTLLSEHLRQEYHLVPIIGVGSMVNELLDARRSFEEACLALNAQSRSGGAQLYWYGQLPAASDGYYFPIPIAQQLRNLAKTGDKAEVVRLLQELYERNTQERRLPLDKLRLFLYEAWGGLVKLTDEMSAPLDRRALPAVETSDEAERCFRTIVDHYGMLCDSVRTTKKSHNRQLYDKIVAYMEASYVRSSFGVADAAERFHISENYLSQFFKEQSGTTFSDYLLKLRMRQAEQLLRETTIPIHEVATKVGYNSSNTFCRAFKKHNGINATAYRSAPE